MEVFNLFILNLFEFIHLFIHFTGHKGPICGITIKKCTKNVMAVESSYLLSGVKSSDWSDSLAILY